jgi:hypothetical protein
LLKDESIMALQTATLRDAPASEQIQSTFALDMLTRLANQLSVEQFNRCMARTFGEEIPPSIYTALQERLIARQIAAPAIIIHSDDYTADYDNRDRIIRIHSSVVAEAFESPDTSNLADILLHEFGHHIDNILRHDLHDDAAFDAAMIAADAQGEEGVRFSFSMALLGNFEGNPLKIATCRYSPWNREFDIVANGPAVQKSILERYSENSGKEEHQHLYPDREAFESGKGDKHHMTHMQIERVLSDFTEAYELQSISFGNWLRDHSQILDPKIVRATHVPKNFPDVLSRDALTRIVDVLSIKQFTSMREQMPSDFTVSPERLGVYRPSEHIDNPRSTASNAPDPTTRDPDFEQLVLTGNPLLEVDHETSMKRYIKRSEDFMASELRNAMLAGRTPAGMRDLGSALHVLEDFFSHSNFVELALIKNGHSTVLPWTSAADCKAGLPLVTGMFGASDAVASLIGPVGEIIFSTDDVTYQPARAGDRSPREQMLLILLEEHYNQDYLKIYQAYLTARDAWVTLPFTDFLQRCAQYFQGAAAVVGNATGIIMKDMLKLFGESIGDWQTRYGQDPHENGSTDPTHSQLAKDHAEHPLHLLAGSLAEHAVRKVAEEIFAYWNGNPRANPEAVTRSFFRHPQDSDWQDEKVISWAAANPEAVARSSSITELLEINRQLAESGSKALERMGKDGEAYLAFIRGELYDQNSPLWFLSSLTPAGPLSQNILRSIGFFDD